ncbi:MAG: 30S ribosomal protein S16 [Patescibacteria group bacterium]|nr:30S ribosomal protein S16 [Patescibacteria group bacterium]
MLAIRFQRTGRKNDPSFRIIVSEKTRHPKAGNPLQVIGSYNPKTKHTVIDKESVKHWLSKGAKASGTVHNLLIRQGVVEGKKVNVVKMKNVKKGEAAQAAASAPAAQSTDQAEAAPEKPADTEEVSTEAEETPAA